tara:strand:- start:6875 stop:7621 length:747 start_codon:yes stop_codon:yes gene_type:complete
MNKFLITGIPRSGTTILVKTLAKLNDVEVYDDQEGFAEPFKIVNKKLDLNPYLRLTAVEDKCNSKYFGFKCFPGDLLDINQLNEQRNYKTFAIIRKDIWKALFSYCVAKTKFVRDSTDIFKHSSTLHTQRPLQTYIDDWQSPLNQMIRQSYFWRVKSCYEFETQWKNTDIIYFEDLIKPNASFECLNEYFGQEIIFNLDYDDSHDTESYYANFSPEVLSKFSKHMLDTIVLPDDCPDYIKQSICKFIK